ncbi:uncharacterized protein HMPREF1541_04931 [Cyphellophora europaea CBS 101466]|uniref:AB hydrolase-1 domain-containing protein n=1 Tax=Cyphellophora europaea (strain CBS 101466) TaxID=1220924 RepID=W2RW22_CYPE1|nr:uncharacterized protein HMPREF1541_04931 [Cyphellophora europaea CBS 101466]ETN40652.1 hypothetical protein HMPREF1541_04931 [Cyphellophora europaea CBS 101466]
MPLSPRLSNDVFIHVPQHLLALKPPGNNDSIRVIFYLTGNPGLLSYYHEYLALLASSEEGRDYVIVGFSLGGFEDVELDENDNDLLFPDAVAGKRGAKTRGEDAEWWRLEEQVNLAVARIDEVVRRLGRSAKVTLMGHSVGTWLALEVVSCAAERRERMHEPVADASGVLGVGANPAEVLDWDIEACVLLAPTIVDLAKSPSGIKAAPIMARLSFLPWLLQLMAAGLAWALSESAIQWLIGRFMGLDANLEGVRTTARFLQSPGGVRQALEMAKEELVSISADGWGPEVWGVGDAVESSAWNGQGGPLMYFLFAQKDHWIGDRTRNDIIRTRGRHDGRGSVVVDEKKGLVHAWCLRQNRAVSEYVKPWLEDVKRS